MSRSMQSLPILSLLLLAACATTPPDVVGAGTQLEARQIQTREYDTLNKAMTMRSVVATLQDLGFTIDQADAGPGRRHRDSPARVHDANDSHRRGKGRSAHLRSRQRAHRREQRDRRRHLPGLFRRPRQSHVPDPAQSRLTLPLIKAASLSGIGEAGLQQRLQFFLSRVYSSAQCSALESGRRPGNRQLPVRDFPRE